jgi:Fe-S-cluster containining protein
MVWAICQRLNYGYFATMDVPDIARQVETVFFGLDQQIAAFQAATSLHCRWGCGKCCFKADLEATVLEFLPFALYLHGNDQAWTWLEKIRNEGSGLCPILNPTQPGAGLCSQYQHRGLICRLFGYSARLNKYREKELVTCTVIKTEQAEAFQRAEDQIEKELPIPVMSDFYLQLHAIEPNLAREFLPIRQAIAAALEIVLHYFSYRESREGGI